MTPEKQKELQDGMQLANQVLQTAKKEGWFAKSWRPAYAASFLASILNAHVLEPALGAHGIALNIGNLPPLLQVILGALTGVLMICRTVEKVAEKRLSNKTV